VPCQRSKGIVAYHADTVRSRRETDGGRAAIAPGDPSITCIRGGANRAYIAPVDGMVGEVTEDGVNCDHRGGAMLNRG
jgi:hypothetical protein